jgi:phage repressor protein C with HTH and peptisase S24 domain
MKGSDFKSYLRIQNITQDKAAETLGVSRQTINTWCKTDSLDIDIINKIKAKYKFFTPYNVSNEINTEYSNSDNLHVFNDKNINHRQNAELLNTDIYNIINVPLVQEYAYAGYLSGFTNNEYVNTLPTIPLITEKESKGNYIAFQVRGDSMNDNSIDAYQHGDIVFCKEINKVHWVNKLHINKWDFIIVHNTEGILLKKIVEHNATTGAIKLHSLNPFFDDMDLNLKNVSQLFNIIKIERKK